MIPANLGQRVKISYTNAIKNYERNILRKNIFYVFEEQALKKWKLFNYWEITFWHSRLNAYRRLV